MRAAVRSALLLGLVLCAPSRLWAQPSFADHPAEPGGALEVLYAFSEALYGDAGSFRTVFASTYVRLPGRGDLLVVEVPLALGERPAYGEETPPRLGNPYLGIRGATSDSTWQVDLGGRLPLLSADAYPMRFTDLDRTEAFMPGYASVVAVLSRLYVLGAVRAVVRAGPVFSTRLEEGAVPGLSILTGFELRYEDERISVGNAVGGRHGLYGGGGVFSRRVLDDLFRQFEFTASVRLGHFRPGATLYLPLSNASRVRLLGLSLRIVP